MTAPRSYPHRVAIAVGLSSLAVIALFLLYQAISVVFMVFGGILLGVFLDGLAQWISRRTPLARRWALLLVGVVLVALALGVGLLIGPRIGTQVSALAEQLPEALARIREDLSAQGWAEGWVRQLPTPEQVLATKGGALNRFTGFISTTVGLFTNGLLVVMLGVYLAVTPRLYQQGLLHLVPRRRRERGAAVLAALGRGLRWWLVGRLSSMALVSLLTLVGLWLIGMPLALSLSIIAGLFSFVPVIGPLASVVPAMVIALAQSGSQALAVAAVYGAVQLIESNLLTPLIQQRAVALPPAMLVGSQLLMGVLFGLLGILFATPMMVTLIILVQMLYVEDVLADPVEVLGANHGDTANGAPAAQPPAAHPA